MDVIYVRDEDLDHLIAVAQAAKARGAYLRVALEDRGVKVCDGQNVWTPALGSDRQFI